MIDIFKSEVDRIYGIKNVSIIDEAEVDETPINVNYILKENEYFKIKLLNKDKSFNCRIEFALILTEPDYEDFDNYPIIKDTTYGNDDEISFNMQKDFYIGKTGHYNLDMKYHLSNNCEKYCKLCSFDLNNIINRCLICKYNYTLIENINGINDKECFNESSSKSLDEIINNLDELMKNTDPNQTYFMDGDGYSVIIKDYDEIVEESTVTLFKPQVLFFINSILFSTDKKFCFSELFATAIVTESNSCAACSSISKCPFVNGSKLPAYNAIFIFNLFSV